MGIGVHNYGTDYSGTTAKKPLNPPVGEIYYDTSIEQLLVFTGTSWLRINDTYEAHTSGDTLTAAETSTKHDNTGASGAVILVLPVAAVGLNFLFKVVAVQDLVIDPNGTDTIEVPDGSGDSGGAGKKMTADAAGETLELVCKTALHWSVASYSGTWTAEA